MSIMKDKVLLKLLKEIDVVQKGEVVMRGGQKSDFYCNIKKAYGYPKALNRLATVVGKLLPKNTTAVAASGLGGLPIASVVSVMFKKKFIAVRNTIKDYGKKSLLDGYIPTKKDNIVIIDDVLTTGSSIKETIKALNESLPKIKLNISSAIVVVERNKVELPVPYKYVLDIDDIKNF